MRQITVRVYSPALEAALEQRARESNRSVNQLVLDILKRNLLADPSVPPAIGDALDRFVGDLSEGEAEALLADVESCRRIDPEQWR